MNGDSPDQPAPPTNDSNWHYTPAPEQSSAYDAPAQPPTPAPAVTWTASEFIAHHKGFHWYALFLLVAVGLTALVYLVTRDVVSVLFVGALILLFGVSAARQPRVLTYRLDHHGLTIGQKFYMYSDFRSFSVSTEGAVGGLDLLPLKRFMAPISVYYDSKDEAHILEIISQHLPFEPRSNDLVDRLARRIRF